MKRCCRACWRSKGSDDKQQVGAGVAADTHLSKFSLYALSAADACAAAENISPCCPCIIGTMLRHVLDVNVHCSMGHMLSAPLGYLHAFAYTAGLLAKEHSTSS